MINGLLVQQDSVVSDSAMEPDWWKLMMQWMAVSRFQGIPSPTSPVTTEHCYIDKNELIN